MLTLSKPTASPVDPSHSTPDMPGRHEAEKVIKNSMITPTVLPSLPRNSNKEQVIKRKQAEKVVQNIKNTPKPTFQQSNNLKMSSDFARTIDTNSQKAARGGKTLKRRTLGSELYTEGEAKKNNGDGFATSRSIAHEHSLSKLSANYIEVSLREEEEIFKRIEEKALMLKQKEKKGRQIIKQIRKNTECMPQEGPNVTASLSAIAPMKSPKSKLSHKRGQSCDLPLIDSRLNSEGLRDLEKVNSEFENESMNLSVMEKSCETIQFAPQLFEMHSQLDLLKEELSQNKQQLEKKNDTIKGLEEKTERLSAQLKQSAISLQRQQQIALNLKQENSLITKTRKYQLEQLQLNYQQQISKKDLQLLELGSTISSQTIKLRDLQAKCLKLQQQLSKNNDEIQALQRQAKTKNQEYHQTKRKLERDIAQLTEERRKSEQSYLKEIQTLKAKVQQQINEEKGREKLRLSEIAQKEQNLNVISSQLKLKQAQISSKLDEQQLSYKKERQQLETLNQSLKDQINKQNQAISKLSLAKQEIESANKTLQLYLANAEEHIRKVEEKYHSASKELTEKNLSYDFLWMQLKEEEDKSKLLEERLKRSKQTNEQEGEPHGSLLQSSENESPTKPEEKEFNHILSSSTLKDIKDLHGMIGQANSSKEKRSPSEKEVKMPFCHKPSLNLPLPLLADSKCSNQGEQPEQEVVLEQVQSTSCNMLLKNEISDAFSEQNDEIFQMASNKNSNTSKMQSSVGAFSEYSRAKSTQSALSHSQMEKEYQSKMKNSKLLAKLGKLKAKK